MTLRTYEELVLDAGLTGQTLGMPTDNALGKLLAMSRSNMLNKAVQRTVIGAIIVWVAFIFIFVFPNLEDSSFFFFIPLFCVGPIVIAAAVVGVYQLIISTLLGSPEMLMSSVVLRRGDDLQFHYLQPIKRATTLKTMTFALILRESATYDQGTTTVTETHDHIIDQNTQFEVALSPETGIDQQITFIIPDSAMHTLEVTRNTLHWYLQVHLAIPNFPDFHKIYKLRVLAEVNHES